jgi:hypothetical protein
MRPGATLGDWYSNDSSRSAVSSFIEFICIGWHRFTYQLETQLGLTSLGLGQDTAVTMMYNAKPFKSTSQEPITLHCVTARCTLSLITTPSRTGNAS